MFSCEPREVDGHSFKQAVPMGRTELSEQEVLRLLRELSDQWLGHDYQLLERNCCDFSNEMCKRLGVGQIPGWVKSAAGLGARLKDAARAEPLRAALAQGKASRGAAASDEYVLGDLTRGVSSNLNSGASGCVSRGKLARGASADDSYQVGDIGRGVATSVGTFFTGLCTEGKRAREASETDGYRFGDLTRGLVSSLAKR